MYCLRPQVYVSSAGSHDPHSVGPSWACGSLGKLRSGLGTWGEEGSTGDPFHLPFFTSH